MARRRLSQQQSRRVEQSQHRRSERRRSGDASTADGQLGPEAAGVVVAGYGHRLAVEDEQGRLLLCSSRQHLPLPVAGDRVLWQASGGGQGVIVAIEPRVSELARLDRQGRPRALAANVDLVVVVCAPRPALNEFLVDRYLVAVEDMGVEALVILNKADLLEPEARADLLARLESYRDLGYAQLITSKRSLEGIDALQRQLAGRTAVMVGQSGVGKSSLVATLLPDREVAVRAVSETTGFGTHTTTNACLYHLPSGGSLIDSPGVRGFEPTLTLEALDRGFRELLPLLGRCRFSDCSHTVEPGCRLQEAVRAGQVEARRYQSFLQLREEIAGRTAPGGSPA